MEKKLISYENISSIVEQLAQNITTDYDFIVGVSRGGLIPATLLAYKLNKKVLSFGISTYSGTTQNNNYDIYQHINIPTNLTKVLVVDDICDTGNTFNIIKNEYTADKHNLKLDFAALYTRESKARMLNYYGLTVSEGIWLDFPWD